MTGLRTGDARSGQYGPGVICIVLVVAKPFPAAEDSVQDQLPVARCGIDDHQMCPSTSTVRSVGTELLQACCLRVTTSAAE